MQGNPAEEWQRLTEHYREISDEELRELAADFVDLTQTAQEVLRNEMRNRGLGDPLAANQSPPPPSPLTALQPDHLHYLGLDSNPPLPTHADHEHSSSHDYT